MQKKKITLWSLVVGIILTGCVGTDFIEDPQMTVPARITITPTESAIQVNEKIDFQAVYFDSLGSIVEPTSFQWISSDTTIAVINAMGEALGKEPGQTMIVAIAKSVSSDPVLLTVVADPNQVASVVVTPASSQISVGETLRFRAVALNLGGESIAGKTFSWRSSDPSVASIDITGLAAAMAPGVVNIIATTDGIDSSPAILEVLGQSRTGTFTKRPGTSYNVAGTVILQQQADGSLVVNFGSDFSSSNGPGLVVFLSTSNVVNSNSLNIGNLKSTSGAQSYDVLVGTQLTSYDWVIIHCVPFNVTFGFAQLQ